VLNVSNASGHLAGDRPTRLSSAF